jgi:hypothetical protein
LIGIPRRLITDRGTSFTSHELQRYISGKDIKHILNAVATPRANGQIERYNRTLIDSLTSINHGKPDNEWDLAIHKVQWSLNNNINKGKGKTPAETLFGISPTGSCDSFMNALVSDANALQNLDQVRDSVERRIISEQEKMKLRFDNKRKIAHVYEVGDLVRIQKDVYAAPGQSRKLIPKCSGPYRVTKVPGNERYEVQDTPITRKEGKPQYTGVYPVDKIYPWLAYTNDPVASYSDEKSESD